MQIKTCECGVEFSATGARQVLCPECQKERKLELQRQRENARNRRRRVTLAHYVQIVGYLRDGDPEDIEDAICMMSNILPLWDFKPAAERGEMPGGVIVRWRGGLHVVADYVLRPIQEGDDMYLHNQQKVFTPDGQGYAVGRTPDGLIQVAFDRKDYAPEEWAAKFGKGPSVFRFYREEECSTQKAA